MRAPVVVLGSGLAGYTLAREFRKLDPETPLVVISRDHAGFYSKPMLSNALAGRKTAATMVMKPAAKMADELKASVRDRSEVVHIDTAARTLRLQDRDAARGDGSTVEVVPYRDLVLAVGADPIRIALDGDAAGEVLSVNDLDDYGRFADRLDGVSRVAILGAGLIGCEFANDLLARGIMPTVVDPAAGPLSRLLPPEAGERLRRGLETAGVRFRFGVAAARVDRADSGFALVLDDGSIVETDLVLSAVGLKPRVEAAREAGLAVARGIVCDRHLATSAAARLGARRLRRGRRPSAALRAADHAAGPCAGRHAGRQRDDGGLSGDAGDREDAGLADGGLPAAGRCRRAMAGDADRRCRRGELPGRRRQAARLRADGQGDLAAAGLGSQGAGAVRLTKPPGFRWRR